MLDGSYSSSPFGTVFLRLGTV